MTRNLSSDRTQNINETCRTEGLLFGEQWSTMAGKVCLSEYVLEDCWGGGLLDNCPLANSSPSFTTPITVLSCFVFRVIVVLIAVTCLVASVYDILTQYRPSCIIRTVLLTVLLTALRLR